MFTRFEKHINTSLPFLKESKILIAISGGVDSVVLTYLLDKLQFGISLAHCNFKLRGSESDKDEEFVKELGEKLQIQTFITYFDTNEYSKKNKVSIQVAARELRYTWFQELIDIYHFDYLLTAHHADDNLETFLINLSRGTGLSGLTGIPVVNAKIIRPLLIFSSNEIEQFALKNNISWREDQSNASTKYIRNKIRHQVIPILKEINPNLLASFQKTTEHLNESQIIINNAIDNLKNSGSIQEKNNLLKIDISKIKELTHPKAYLYEYLKDFGFTEWNDVIALLDAQSGKMIFSKTHRLLKDRTFLLLAKIKTQSEQTEYLISENTKEISTPIQLTFEDTAEVQESNKETIYIDAEKIIHPLTLRKWQNGDYFYPIGMSGKKKISKFFKDEKFSIIDKENTWLLCSKNEIIWIVGCKQDRRFLPNTKTSSVLKLHLTY